MTRFVYDFGEIGYEGVDLVSGKGAGLSEMTRLQLPENCAVPCGFTITTEAGRHIRNGKLSKLEDQVRDGVSRLEEKTGKRFGEKKNPLLVSIRSGAKVSMPGIMHSILNVGVTESMIKGREYGLYKRCYNRLRDSFRDLDPSRKFPKRPWTQLRRGIEIVNESWYSQRAQDYREVMGLSEDMGTAIHVQTMVFGDYDIDSFTAAFFTRDPSTGERAISGSFLMKAQGESLVNGENSHPIGSLNTQPLNTLKEVSGVLEDRFRDMQEVEVTSERKKMYLLQTRSGKRTTIANVRILLDLLKEGKISEEEAIRRLDPATLSELDRVQIDPTQKIRTLFSGFATSPGISKGYIAYDAQDVDCLRKDGLAPIWITERLDTDDIKTIAKSEGIITKYGKGNSVAHALVTARGMNKPCVTGCESISRGHTHRWIINSNCLPLNRGKGVTIDGSTGRIMDGHVKTVQAVPASELEEILELTRDAPNDPTRLFRARNMKEVKKLVENNSGILYETAISGVNTLIQRAASGDTESLIKLRELQSEEYQGVIESLEESGLPLMISPYRKGSIELLLGNPARLQLQQVVLESLIEEGATYLKKTRKNTIGRLGKIRKARPSRVYQTQMKAIELALKRSEKKQKGITGSVQVVSTPLNATSITINGIDYRIHNVEDLCAVKLARAREELENV